MLVLGLATSYAPAMFREPVDWPKIHEWLTEDAPQPPQLAEQTLEVIQQQADRVDRAIATLGQLLEDVRAEVLLVLASDSLGRMFTAVQIPQFCTYLGDELWGSGRFQELREPAEDIIRLPCAAAVARFVQAELVQRGFDMNYSQTFRALGQPDYGASPSLILPARALRANRDVPVVPIWVNTNLAPVPNGRRCYAFGQALAEILEERPERVAILASGGLSHDHHGERAGWIDEPLDRWVVDKLSRGKGMALTSMYDLESDALRGGGAEIRLWTAVAGACESAGAKAVVVDYIPAYMAATGLGFCYWPMG